MSENTAPESGSSSMTMNEAAGAFLGLMERAEAPQEGEPDDAPKPQEAQAAVETESDDQETSAEESEIPEPQRFKVKAAGEDREVTFEELVDGYQKGIDYTKKSQLVADQRKQVESEKVALEQAKQARDVYAHKIALIDSFLQQQDKGEDLDALKYDDPIGYAVKVAERSEREKQVSQVQAERARIVEQQKAEQFQQLRQYAEQQKQRVVEVIPEYGHPEKGDQVRQDLRDVAKHLGFTDEEIAQAYDSRMIHALHLASQYVKLQKQSPSTTKKVQEAPKMLRPGTAAAQRGSTDENLKKAQAQLRRSGKVSDAASVFEKFI